MDIYGRKPTSEHGEYFRNIVSWWHPLAGYCQKVAPEITSACRDWHTNDGDGLDAAGAFALAEALQKEINANRTDAYARRYASEQEMMPDEPCSSCAGTGTGTGTAERTPNPFDDDDDLKEGGIKCGRCQGTGYVRPWQT